MGASSRRLRVDAGCCQYFSFYSFYFVFCTVLNISIVKSSCEPAALPATTFPVTINQKHKISLDFLKKSLKVKEVTLMCWLFVLHNEIALNCCLYLTYAPYSCFLHLPVFVSDLNYMQCETCSRLM